MTSAGLLLQSSLISSGAEQKLEHKHPNLQLFTALMSLAVLFQRLTICPALAYLFSSACPYETFFNRLWSPVSADSESSRT